MFVINILNENPLKLKISFEFKCMVLPPEGEGLFVVA
jgi:hypothetical protein